MTTSHISSSISPSPTCLPVIRRMALLTGVSGQPRSHWQDVLLIMHFHGMGANVIQSEAQERIHDKQEIKLYLLTISNARQILISATHLRTIKLWLASVTMTKSLFIFSFSLALFEYEVAFKWVSICWVNTWWRPFQNKNTVGLSH